MRSKATVLLLGIGAACALAACSGDDTPQNPGTPDAATTPTDAGHDAAPPAVDAGKDAAAPTPDAGVDAAPPTPASAVYTMTNAAAGNAVLGFTRAADGSLTPMAQPFSTGGKGTGKALGEQGALAYDTHANRVYAVNAGDDSFSVFPVNADGSLGTAVNVPAGSAALKGPKSVTFRGDVVYVLFEGDASTASAIAGWTITASGATAIAGSVLALSNASASADPAQVTFSPDGQWLVVTEKATSMIDTFHVDAQGLATKGGFFPTASAGPDAGTQMVPYGFGFYGKYIVVSEAGSTGAGSYTYDNGTIAPVTGGTQFLPTDPAPCWVAIASDWAYVANARGPNVSGFTVSAANGGLTNIGSAANAVVATTGKAIAADGGTTFQGPTDETVSADGQFLYVLDAAVPAIGIFKVNADGTLARVGSGDYTAASLAAGVVGLAAR